MVDHPGQVTPAAVQLGRGQPPGLLEEDPFAAAADVLGGGELVDHIHDHPGLVR